MSENIYGRDPTRPIAPAFTKIKGGRDIDVSAPKKQRAGLMSNPDNVKRLTKASNGRAY